MTLSQFVNKYIGKQIPDPWGNYFGECVSMVKTFAKEVQKIDPADLSVNGRAKNAWLEYNKNGWKKHYTQEKTPKPGDIAVYDGNYGDMAIVIDSTHVFGQYGTPVFTPAKKRNINAPSKPLGFLRLRKSATVENMKPTKAQVGNMFNQLGVADNKVTSKQYKHYTSKNWNVLGFDIAKALRKKWLDARKQRDSAKKELEKTAKTLESIKKQLAEVKVDDIKDEQKKAELTSTITKLEKDLDLTQRKVTEDSDTNKKVNIIFDYFSNRWQTFRDFLNKTKE